MNRRPAATAMLAFTLLGTVFSVVFAQSVATVAFPVVIAGYAVVGWLVARKQPANTVGWLLLLFAVVGGLNGVASVWAEAAARWDWPGAALATWSQTWLWAPMLGLTFGPLLVLFPDGQLVPARARIVLWLSAVFIVLGSVGNALFPFAADQGGPNPYGLEGQEASLRLVQDLAGLALMLSLIGGMAALVVRYRRADRLQRQQLKWFLFAAALLPVAIVVGEQRSQALQEIAVPIGLALLAAAIGIAILRHGLYDIDRIISRTVGWALVTVVIGALYLGAVTVLSAATASVAGDSTVAVAASTLAAAAAFGPVRLRVQSTVDRRFNRSRYDAARTVQAYRTQLRDDLDIESITVHLQSAVSMTLQPERATLWLRTPEPAS